jgi:hypothetical protein
MVSKGDHPQMALIQASELLQFTQIYGKILKMLVLSLHQWLG